MGDNTVSPDSLRPAPSANVWGKLELAVKKVVRLRQM